MKKAIMLSLLLLATPATGEEGSGVPEWVKKTKIDAELFGDAYYMAKHHDPAIKDADGFWIRRINLSLNSKLADKLVARLRFEMNSSGDFKTSERMTPYVKDAWVKWQGKSQGVTFGLFGTPTWEIIEKTWGYRSVEKTAVELQRLGNSRDMGIGLDGTASDGKVYYNVMLGNGADTRNEVNRGKKVYAALGVRPSKPWVAEVYADYEARPGKTDRKTIQAFTGYRVDGGRVGASVARQYRQREGADDLVLDIFSLFGVYKVHQRVHILARFDRMMDANPDGAGISYLPFDTTAKSSLFIAGIDIEVAEGLNVIPNIEYVLYRGSNVPDDLMLRATAVLKF